MSFARSWIASLGRRLVRSLARSLRRGGRRWTPPRAQTADALGRRGERLAVRALRRAGYRVLERRLRTRRGEIDVLALDGATVVVVEVKTTVATGAPAERVDHRKRRRLGAAWAALPRRGDLARRPRRLDVVTVALGGGRPSVRILRGFGPLENRAR